MLNWNESYNWTYTQYRDVMDQTVKNKETQLSLDTEHSDYKNEQDLLKWIKEGGYIGEIRGNSIIVKLNY